MRAIPAALTAAVLATCGCGGAGARGDSKATRAGASTGTAGATTSTGAGTPAGAGAAGASPCGSAGGHTLAADRIARVYSLGGAVYGCRRGTHHSYRLGAASRSIREGRVGPVALAGAIAAYGLASFGVDTGSSQVVVRRLSDGHQLKALATVTRPLGPESYVSVGSVVVRSDGAVAWIGVGASIIRHGRDVEVHRDDSRGGRLLDASTAVDPGSLRLTRSTLRWTHGSARHTADLR